MESKRQQIESLLDRLASLADFTLIAGFDHEKVPVVRKLLTQNSVYFEKLLGPSFREGSQQEVILQDIDGPTLTAIITFIYSGNVDLTEQRIANILDGASRMELVTPEKSCGEFLQKNLSKENCIQTLVLADQHCFDALKANALESVGRHFKTIPKSDILQLDARIFGEILKFDKICAAETSLFELLVEWVEHKELVRPRFMANLLKSIRFERLPGNFIVSVVEPVLARYESDELVFDLYVQLMRQYVPTDLLRYREQPIAKSIFLANISEGQSINIYKCYPEGEQLASIPLPTSIVDQGWAFHDGRFYQMGGYSTANGGRTMAEVECFDMDTKRRTKMPNMINARSKFKPVVAGKYIYVFGGGNKHGDINDCERFDTENQQWEALPKLTSALRNCVGIELNGKIFVVGDLSDERRRYSKYRCEYELTTNRWSDLQLFYSGQPRITLVKQDNYIVNVMLNFVHIFNFDTRNSPSVWSQGKNILLPGTDVSNIEECAGSPYIFYKSSGENKFGRVVFNGDEWNIVDSVDISQYLSSGFLFMH